MCPKQVHDGSSDLPMFLSVVMIDWGDLRGQILKYFPALGSPLVGRCAHWLQNYVTSPWPAGPYLDDRVFSPFFGGGFPPFSICVRYVLVCSNIFIICVYQPSIWWRNPQKVLCKESYCYGRYAVRYALIYFDIYWAKYQHIHRYAPSRKHQAALYVCVCIVFILVGK